ncbi:MAG: hypothetical protein ABL921_22155 [Pirellula sp.]
MKIAWYTPYSTYSAIGAFSREVIRSLHQMDHEVITVRCESPNSSLLKSEAVAVGRLMRAIDIDQHVEEFLEGFDAVVYNIGNHLHNHHFAIEHQKRVPGVTILHDFLLHHLLSEQCSQSNGPSYEEILVEEAGLDAVNAFREAALGSIQTDWYMSKASEFPVLRFAIAKTLGVVTHADFYRESTRRILNCPITTIPLAYPQQMEASLELPKKTMGRMRLLTIGDVNTNKRCESIIRAIGGSSELAANWEYRIAGSITKNFRDHLHHLAKSVPFPVELCSLGKVDDQTLKAEVESTHAISCLRHPIIEGASASVIVALSSGRPTLVSDGGCYAEIPNTLVFRVTVAKEIEDIGKRLSEIFNNYNAAIQISTAARSWSLHRHSGGAYARELVPFLESIIRVRPLIHLSDKVGRCLADWDCPSNAAVVDRMVGIIAELFPNSTDKTESRT